MLLTCRLQDLAGYGVALAVGKEFSDAFPDRTFKTPLVELLVKSGRNGDKNFHDHPYAYCFDVSELLMAFCVNDCVAYVLPLF